MGCAEGYPLGMIPGTRCNHTALALLLGELDHAVVCTTQLEGEDRLEVFPLEPDVIVQPTAEIDG